MIITLVTRKTAVSRSLRGTKAKLSGGIEIYHRS